jgi:hypothetical protein
MAFDIQAAKQAGYTDDEINAYLQAKPKTEVLAPVAPGQEIDPGEPPPPPPASTYEQAGSGSILPGVATAAAAAAPYAVPAALAAGGWKGMNVAKSAFDAMKEASTARTAQANAQAASAQGLQQRFEMREAAKAAQAAGQSAGPKILGPNGMPMSSAPAPITPPAAPPVAAPQPAPQMQAAKSIVQKLALDRVMQGAGNMLKGSVGPGMALYSGGLNTNEAEELRRRQAMPNPYAR